MTPLYQQILDDLMVAIKAGKYPPGTQLPTEKELSDTYNVSRITSKRALTELEQAGVIYRVRGKGSFVKDLNKPFTKKANRILFLLPFINDLSLGNFTEELLPLMVHNNIDLMMASLNYLNQKKAEDITSEFDGLIYYPDNIDHHLGILAELEMVNFPVVFLDKKIYELPFPTVVSDNLSGGYEATQLLIEQAHQKIGYIFASSRHPQSVRQRYLGYLRAIKESGLDFYTEMDDTKAVTEDVTHYIKNNNITALVCENDLTAIQTMKALIDAGIAVPDDVSIIGFDDIQAAGLISPPLTTIAQDFRTLGRLAGEAIIAWIESDAKPADVQVPIKLIKRESTKEQHR